MTSIHRDICSGLALIIVLLISISDIMWYVMPLVLWRIPRDGYLDKLALSIARRLPINSQRQESNEVVCHMSRYRDYCEVADNCVHGVEMSVHLWKAIGSPFGSLHVETYNDWWKCRLRHLGDRGCTSRSSTMFQPYASWAYRFATAAAATTASMRAHGSLEGPVPTALSFRQFRCSIWRCCHLRVTEKMPTCFHSRTSPSASWRIYWMSSYAQTLSKSK